MTVTIIGVGLIGGSLAISLRDKRLADHIIGIDNKEEHLQTAKRLGLIDEYCPLEEAVQKSTLVVLAVPVDAIMGLLPFIMHAVSNQVIMDMGATKENLINIIKDHPKK